MWSSGKTSWKAALKQHLEKEKSQSYKLPEEHSSRGDRTCRSHRPQKLSMLKDT